MMNKRKVTIVIIAVIGIFALGAIVMGGLSKMKKAPQKPPTKELRRLVEVATVEYSDIDATVIAPGRLASGQTVNVVAEAGGKIEQGAIPLKTGQKFSKGQVLCSIYKDEVELTLKSSKASFLTALAGAAPDIKVDFPDFFKTYSDFIDAVEIDKNLPDMPKITSDKLKVFLASRNILSSYYQIKQAEKALARHTIYAPFTGTYTSVSAEVGTYTNPGGRIASIIRTDNLEMEVPVETFLSEWINVGDKVRIFAKNRDAETTGRVIRKSDFVDPNTQSRTIYVRIAGGNKLLAGEYLMAEFKGGTIEEAMEIPRNCLFNHNEVYLVENERLTRKQVNVIKTNENTVIINGLDEGSKLVTQALINVEDNILVDMEEKKGK
jgi:multidrug efflux pump subunit AcrA (membrane-fusion protein)